MAVVLPRDDRWGALGAGLSNLVGGAVEQYQQQQAVQGVAQVQQDASVPAEQKFSEVLRRYGDRGINVYMQMMKMQALTQEVQLHRAETRLKGAQAEIAEQKAPYAAAKAQKDVEAEEALVGARTASAAASRAQVPLREAEVKKVGAEEAAAGALVPLRQAQVGKVGAEQAATEELARKRAAETTKLESEAQPPPGGFNVEASFKSLVPNATPSQVELARVEYAAGKTHQAGLAKMGSYAQSLTKPGTISQPEEVRMGNWSGAYENLNTSFEAFKRNPGGIGLFSGATIEAMAEGHGIPTGNPQVVEIWTSAARNVIDAAKQGSVFASGVMLKAARDITPGLTETPLHYAQVVNQAARETIGRIRSDRDLMVAGRKPVEVHEALMEKFEKIERESRLDYWATNDRGGKPTGRSAVIYRGNAVNPKTFETLIRGDQEYKAKDGKWHSGRSYIETAKEYGEDPVAVAREAGVEFKP